MHCDCLKGAVRLFTAWQILHKIAVICCFVCNNVFSFRLIAEKRMFNGLPEIMTRVAEEEMRCLSNDITECHIIYLPQVGIKVISIKFSQSFFVIPCLANGYKT